MSTFSAKRWLLSAVCAFLQPCEGAVLSCGRQAEQWVRENLELGVRLMFSLGDTAFNDPQHHGQPEFRAAMVRAGYDSADLELDAAFERGMKYAGLR